MDEFEKIRAFSEQMSQKTEQALEQEKAETGAQSVEENPDFLKEWAHQETEEGPAAKNFKKAFWCVFALATLVLGCLVAIVYILLREPMDNQENVPTISPTPLPVKVKPENPGGMVIPDQDKVIYDRVSQDPVPVKVEKLFPDEEPVLPAVEEKIEIAEAEDIMVPVFVEEDSETIIVPENEIKPEPKQEEKKIETVHPAQETKVDPKMETKEKATLVTKETWHAQLFSSTDKNKVEKIWNTILVKHKGLLSDMPMNVVQAEIAGKGTFYRLQIGSFETREMAANLCAKLKKQKQDCIPAK